MKTVLTIVGIFIFSVSMLLINSNMGHANSSSPIALVKYNDPSDSAGSFSWYEQSLRVMGQGNGQGPLLLAAGTDDDESQGAGDEPEEKNKEDKNKEEDNRLWGAPELG